HDTQQNVNSSVLAVARDIQRLGAVVRRGDKYYELKQVFEKLAAHMPRPEQVLKDPQALEQQSIADDEEATLLTKEQAQVTVTKVPTPCLFK
ncbi:Syntaxin, partial [Operophtera brumata]